jgi:ABC-type transport system involved in multi-copper enzyme maturation permease subunit
MAAGIPAAGIALVVFWLWMFLSQIDNTFLPGRLLAHGLITAEATQIVLALLIAPALVAGSIAGEKDRGTLALLLTSRLTAREIILGRLVGCLSQVALLTIAATPSIVVLAASRRVTLIELLLLIGLPAGVALGAGGLTIAVSVLTKRGRDALIAVYGIEAIMLAVSFLAGGSGWLVWLETLNPLAAIYLLVAGADVRPALGTVTIWLGLAVTGALVAIWQLRPAYRRQSGDESTDRGQRRRKVTEIDRWPMLWKELQFESYNNLGSFGKWLNRLLAGLLLTGAALIVLKFVWDFGRGTSLASVDYYAATAIGGSATFVLWLAQWTIGLRAAATIGVERQRSTWDAVLTTPLDGYEIVLAKICGALHAMRWLLVAICLAWTAAMLAGGLPVSTYLNDLALLGAGGAFMAALGVAVSLQVSNAARSMAVTIGLWMAAAVVTGILAWLLSIVISLVAAIIGATFVVATAPNAVPSGGSVGDFIRLILAAARGLSRVGLYVVGLVTLAMWIGAHFDRLAGRMGGRSIGNIAKTAFNSLTKP